MIRPPSPYPFLASRAGEVGRITLLGAPLDRTGSFRPGCGEGPTGIRWASENLETYSPAQDRDLEDLHLGDLGDIALEGMPQQEALARVQEETGRLLDAGSLPFLLGGEHAIALGVARAVIAHFPEAVILQLDAHADLRAEYAGEKYSHACWARHAAEEFGWERLLQIGIRSGTREEFALGRTRSALFAETLPHPTVVHERIAGRPVYISLDIDVLDPGVAPGTGTPEAGGASYHELETLLLALRGAHVVALDVNEVAPPLDPTGATSAVAAKLVREMVLAFGG